jgi:hypothetical protein
MTALLLPFAASARIGSSWSQIFMASSLDADVAESGFFYRMVIKPPGGWPKAGTSLQFVFGSSTVAGHNNDNGGRINHAAVGIFAGGQSNTVATPVPILFGGAAGIAWSRFGTYQSDVVALTFGKADGLVVIIDSLTGGYLCGTASMPGCDCYYTDTGGASYNKATVTGSWPRLQSLMGVVTIGAK